MSDRMTQAGGDTADTSGYGIVVLLVAIAVAIADAGLWGLIRAYTGIWDVLNLRVFVAAFVLMPALAVILAAAVSLKGFAKIFLILVPVLALVPVWGGEYIGALLSEGRIVWQKFNLIWLGIFVVLAVVGSIAAAAKSDEAA